MTVEEFLKNLSGEVDYQFGTPWRYSEKSLGVVVPILKRGELGERGYITLEEAKDQGVSFKDAGRIDRIIVESSIGKPVFIRSGTALKSSGTQPRAVESSVVVVPKIEPEIPVRQEIPVKCIYASKPIRFNETFTYAGHVPLEVGSALLSRSGQSRTWAAIGSTADRFMSSSRSRFSSGLRSDDLVGVMEEVDKFKTNIDEILKNVPLFEDQVGAVFLDIKDVVGLEMFDHPKSWEAVRREVERRLGESAAEEKPSFFRPDYEKIKPLTLEFLKKLIESEKTEISKHGITSTISLRGDGIIGEATTIKGKIIHLVGMRSQESKEKPREAVRSTVGRQRVPTRI